MTWLRAERSLGFESGQGKEVFLYFRKSRLALWATKPPIQRVPGFSLGIKRPELATDHSHPSNAEVEKEWSYTSTVRLCSVDRENFVPYSRQKCRGGGCVHGLPQTLCTVIQEDLFNHSQCSCQ